MSNTASLKTRPCSAITITADELPPGVNPNLRLELPEPRPVRYDTPRTSTIRITYYCGLNDLVRQYDVPLYARQLPLLFGMLFGLEARYCDPALLPPIDSDYQRRLEEVFAAEKRTSAYAGGPCAYHCATEVISYLNVIDAQVYHSIGGLRSDLARTALVIFQSNVTAAHENMAFYMWRNMRKEGSARKTMARVLRMAGVIDLGLDFE